MKHLKTPALATAMAMAFLVLMGAEGASATEFYSGTKTLPAGTEITLTSNSSSKFEDTKGNVLETCPGSELIFKTSNAGGSGVKVTGTGTKYTLLSCSIPIVIVEYGTLEFTYLSGGNAAMVTKGWKIDLSTILFGHCVYTAGTGINAGTLQGSTTSNGSLVIKGVLSKVSGICESSAIWNASFTVTKPVPFHTTDS